MSDWLGLGKEFMEEYEQNESNAALYGFEDAGYAFGHAASNALVLAKLCHHLEGTGVEIPSWMKPESIQVSDDVAVLETVYGWRVLGMQWGHDEYWDGDVLRSIRSLHETRDEALERAWEIADLFEEQAANPESAAVMAEVHMNSAPVVKMVTFKVDSQVKPKSWLSRLFGRK